jgi:hypothetical protein
MKETVTVPTWLLCMLIGYIAWDLLSLIFL